MHKIWNSIPYFYPLFDFFMRNLYMNISDLHDHVQEGNLQATENQVKIIKYFILKHD